MLLNPDCNHVPRYFVKFSLGDQKTQQSWQPPPMPNPPYHEAAANQSTVPTLWYGHEQYGGNSQWCDCWRFDVYIDLQVCKKYWLLPDLGTQLDSS